MVLAIILLVIALVGCVWRIIHLETANYILEMTTFRLTTALDSTGASYTYTREEDDLF